MLRITVEMTSVLLSARRRTISTCITATSRLVLCHRSSRRLGLTIRKNTYGQGKQATAVAARGNKVGFYGAGMYGYQVKNHKLTVEYRGLFRTYDRIRSSRMVVINTTGGSATFSDAKHRLNCHVSNCYIEGAVDYIYGDASAWFGECTLASNGGGAITANSRSTTTDTHYYVIDHSTIVQAASAASALTQKVYLGRPWRVLARVVFQNSVLPDLINPAGYTTLAANATPYVSSLVIGMI